jgi:hypothetical protein
MEKYEISEYNLLIMYLVMIKNSYDFDINLYISGSLMKIHFFKFEIN